jgi:hypothetical protein
MVLLIAVTTLLLWLLLSVLMFALGVVLFYADNRLSTAESMISAVVLVLLATPLVLQIRTLSARRREWKNNTLELTEDSIRICLTGTYRSAKGLPDVAETRIPWCDVVEITKERRKFLYPSLIRFEYPLDVYTIVTEEEEIPFTQECVLNAKRVAQDIAARLGQEI